MSTKEETEAEWGHLFSTIVGFVLLASILFVLSNGNALWKLYNKIMEDRARSSQRKKPKAPKSADVRVLQRKLREKRLRSEGRCRP